ncbi:heavy-metal-associated domain-containing protein [Streptomyces sp. NPDC005813]|uniref:heavy-metal-associated domain-containing protein n=1 Tax=Streptomyces sp. NPDC005813 TaxID=3155592 RepID=UPI0033D583B5
MSNCCTPDGSCHTDAQVTTTSDGQVTTTYKVVGIGSAHCRGVVTDALGGLDEVTAVGVEIGTGLVTVTTAAEPDEALDALIAKTVDEAGYDFAGRATA